MRLVAFFLLALFPLFSNPKDPYILAVTEGEPSSLVEGVVSAITGDLYLAKADEVVQGHVPLPIPRSYVSGDGEGQMAGWVFHDYTWASMVHEPGPSRRDSSHFRITILSPGGSPFTFRGSQYEVETQFYKQRKHAHRWNAPTIFDPVAPSSGITNTSKGWISAHTNFKNARIELAPNAKSFVLRCPDGAERSYALVGEHNIMITIEGGRWENYEDPEDRYFIEPKTLHYLLTWERLPNGNMVFYGYDSSHRLQTIRTAAPNNAKTYASATFSYPSNKEVVVTASDGKTIRYNFAPQVGRRKQRLLQDTNSSASPTEYLSYHGETSYSGYLVKQVATHANRNVEIDYYWNGASTLRVKSLKAPVGTDQTALTTHRFVYDTAARCTSVFEIDESLTKYFYTPSMRLQRIERYAPQGSFINKESFLWSQNGFLLCRTFSDKDDRPLFSRRLFYDRAGNVVEERLYGNLSGRAGDSLVIGNDGLPEENGCEMVATKCQYSQDGRNLLLRKEEPSGKVTLYNYHPQLLLLLSEFTCDRKEIKTRHFYEYNQENVLIREIVDDGALPDPNDLRDVKVRKITYITPMSGGPYVNMPHIIEEKYWDGQGEVLLKKVVLHYGTGGLIVQKDVYDATGAFCYSLKTSYNAYGQPTEEANALGQSAFYRYDSVGNCTFSQDFGGRRSVKTDYDYSNRPIRVEEIGDDGILRATHHCYDSKHNKIATIDSFGQETRYVYDSLGNLLETHLPAAKDLYPVLYAAYDGAGRAISKTDANGNTTKTAYNAQGNPIRIDHPDGTSETFTYNIDGTLKTHIDALGATTSHLYDAFGRLLSKTVSFQGQELSQETYLYDSFQLVQKTDAEGSTTAYFYDGAGRKIAEEIGGERTEYAYDALGRPFSVRKGDLVTITEYDLLDRVISESSQDLSGRILTKILYAYDDAGNRSSITRFPGGNPGEEITLFDSMGRAIQSLDPLGHSTRISYDESYPGDQGRFVLQKIVTDPMGLKTVETHDALGRISRVEKKNSFGETLSLEEMTYDAAGNLLSHHATVLSPEAPSRAAATFWEYGPCNRLLALVEAAGAPEQKTTRYAYTAAGLLEKTIKPDGVILTNSYDALGRQISLASSDGTISYEFSYDRLGRRVESQDLISKTSVIRCFDPQGRLLQETLASGLTLSRSYDSIGRREELHLPDGSFVRYSYDALHVRQIDRYNSSGKLLYSHAYTAYDLNGSLLEEKLIGKGSVLTRKIDPLGRLQSVESPLFAQEIEEFDPAGNIRSLKTLGKRQLFDYDFLHQLSAEEDHTYAYDSQLSRIRKDQETYSVNALHQITDNIVYDLCGNPIRQDHFRYTYDALDRLVAAESPQYRIAIAYDPYNRMVFKTLDVYSAWDGWQREAHHIFLYDGDLEIGALNAEGAISELRILHPDAASERGAAISFELRGTPYLPQHDLFGNVAALATLEGEIVESYRYTAFGEETIYGPSGWQRGSSHVGNFWRYGSKRICEETALVFFGRRFYCPAYGRWMTPDPSGFTDGYNLYAFVYNNPFTGVDLFGLATETHLGHDWERGFFTYEFDPLKQEKYQPDGYHSPSYFGGESCWMERDHDRDVSHAANIAVAAFDAVGRVAAGVITGTATLCQLAAAPGYYLFGCGNYWNRHWDSLHRSNRAVHDFWDTRMQNLLPVERRASYYGTAVTVSECISDGALIAASFGAAAVEVVAARSAGAATRVAVCSKVANEVKNTYHPRIRARAVQDPIAHNFPYSFDEAVLKTTPIKQKDGSLLYKKAGTVNGKEGVYEIALNPETGVIFHRTFKGVKK